MGRLDVQISLASIRIQILQTQLLNSLIMFIDHYLSIKSTIAVYLDFSKAFDTVKNNILLGKLLHNVISGVMQSWFESYLCKRKQYVSIKNYSSSISNITLGNPQGSVLGTVLFFIYQCLGAWERAGVDECE